MVLIIGVVVLGFKVDRQPPVITVEGSIVYTKDTSEQEILSNLCAVDEVDGDVSTTLVVEKIVPSEEKKIVWITCGAGDESGNISKITVQASCDDTFFEKKEEGNEVFQLVAGEAESMITSSVEAETETIFESIEDETEEIVESEPDENEAETELEEERHIDLAIDMDEEEQEVIDEAEQVEIQLPEEQTPIVEERPEFVFSASEVKTSKGYNPAWVTVISRLADNKDSYETLLRRIKIEGVFDNTVVGSYDVFVFVTDSDGNESLHNPIRIIVEE